MSNEDDVNYVAMIEAFNQVMAALKFLSKKERMRILHSLMELYQ